MLSGDLWTVNVMLADGAPKPTITGVLDFGRTSWGDPAADWTIHMALAKPGTERDAFWVAYGPLDRSPDAVLRSRIYEARHIGAIRLERHRLGKPVQADSLHLPSRQIRLLSRGFTSLLSSVQLSVLRPRAACMRPGELASLASWRRYGVAMVATGCCGATRAGGVMLRWRDGVLPDGAVSAYW